MDNINNGTKLLGIIGYPVSQSYSPAMHNKIYKNLGLNYTYMPIEINSESALPSVLEWIRRMNFAGFSVTMPYKKIIMKYLDSIDITAERAGACNTVVIEDWHFKGFNTDGDGFLHSFKDQVNVSDSVFLSIGAGGTAGAICTSLAEFGAKEIIISSRSDSGKNLAESINSRFPGSCVYVKACDSNYACCIRRSDVIMNLSGIGMNAAEDSSPIDVKYIKKGAVCFDAAYNPKETAFLREAGRLGLKTVNGLAMLACQGALQASLWTGIDPPFEEMLKILNDMQGQKQNG